MNIGEEMLRFIDTPALIVDIPAMRANVREYQSAVSSYGVKLRPHVKTHKMPLIAKMQIEEGAAGIVVAKISEAEVMADAGIDDIFVCFPIVGEEKLDRLSSLNRRLKRLLVEVDSIEGAMLLSKHAVKNGELFEVVAEVDVVNAGRTGFKFETAVDEIVKVSSLPGLKVVGIFAYAYMSTRNGTASSPEEAGINEGSMTVKLADELRARGINIEMVAGGSSPTGRYVASVPGITEVHPGTYVFYDTMSRFYGVTKEQCAAAIVATVVSSDEHRACIDAGSKTFSTDLPIDCAPLWLEGYGTIVGRDDLRLDHLSEEHGVITSKKQEEVNLPVGTKVVIIPNHICPCVALHDFAYFIEGRRVEKVRIEARGKLN